MKAKWIQFGEIEIDGERFNHDVVIDQGRIARRKKKASKPFREQYGHTPLSSEENIPWGGERLIIGTGTHGRLPIMPGIEQEARRRGIEIVALPTREACERISHLKRREVRAILHVTC